MRVYYIECLVRTPDNDQFPLIKKVLASTPQQAKRNAKTALVNNGYITYIKDMKIR